MLFKDIPGHQSLKDSLITSHKQNHIAHAQIFSGEEGGASMSLALAFATYLLCEDRSDSDACGKCHSCQKIEKHIHPDLHYFFPGPSTSKDKERAEQIDKWREFLKSNPFGKLSDWVTTAGTENKQVQISKEDAVRIIKTVSMKAFEGGVKILFIWCPEYMNPSSGNAILKVLEEPPPQTIYLLVSHDYNGLLNTIQSRTQLVKVPPVSDDTIESFLLDFHHQDQQKAVQIAKMSKGNFGNAIAQLNNDQNLDFSEFQDWMRLCIKGNFDVLVKKSENFGKTAKSEQRGYLEYFSTLLNHALKIHSGLHYTGSNTAEEQFLVKFSHNVGNTGLEKLNHLVEDALLSLRRNANARIAFMALSLKIASLLNSK